MIMVRQHFFRSTFKHEIRERRKKNRAFSLSKTFSRMPTVAKPFATIKRKLSVTVRRASQQVSTPPNQTNAVKLIDREGRASERCCQWKARRSVLLFSILSRVEGGESAQCFPSKEYKARYAAKREEEVEGFEGHDQASGGWRSGKDEPHGMV